MAKQPARLQMLDSNTTRLQHQHSTLSRILADAPLHALLRQQVSTIDEMLSTVDALKASMQADSEKQGGHGRKGEGEDTRQMEMGLARLAEDAASTRKSALLRERQRGRAIAEHMTRIGRANQDQILALHDHINRYMAQTRQQCHATLTQQLVASLQNSLQKGCEDQCQQLEEDIGLLMCEMQYAESLKNRAQLQPKIAEMRDGTAGEQQVRKGELLLGRLQRQILEAQLQQYLGVGTERLAYECGLLAAKIRAAIECIGANRGAKHLLKGIYSKYEQQAREFARRIGQIEMEMRGIKVKLELSVYRIKILDLKLKALDKQQKEVYTKFKKDLPGSLVAACNECKQLYQEFLKRKTEFLYFS